MSSAQATATLAPQQAPTLAALPRKSPRTALLVLGGVALVVAAIGGGYTLANRGKEATDDAQVDTDVVPLSPRVGGMVAGVAVHDNQDVKKGDLLLEIDPRDYAVKVTQAEAELAAARAQAASADANVRIVDASSKGNLSAARAQLEGTSEAVGGADSQIAVARAAVEHAQVDADTAETDLARAASLHATGALAQAALDDAQSRRNATKAALTLARAQLHAAEDARHVASSRVKEAASRVEQSTPIEAQMAAAHAAADLAHARVDGAAAALEQAKLQLGYTRLYAPADGVVSKLAAHEGQLLAPGQPILELVPAKTYVIANFKETQVGHMKPGARAVIAVDAFPGRTFEGKVESLSGGTGARFSLLPPENATGNFVKVVQRVPVRIEWNGLPADVRLRAGLSADVTVDAP